jgi:Spy/CpxP family protein refolding chaperone
MKLTIALLALSLGIVFVNAQPPAGGPPGAGLGGGRGGSGRGGGRGGGIPGATPEQIQAVNDMNAALAPLSAAVTAANNELMTATFSGKKDDAAINAAIEKLKTAEMALAMKRSEEFAKLQAGPNKLNPDQVNALITAGGRGGGRGPGGPPGAGRGPGAPQ